MKSFLEEIAEEILKTPGNLKDFICILPSKRAGTFLRNELLKKNKTTTFGPTIYSIEDFVQELSRLKLAQNTVLIFEFYQIYLEKTPKEEQEDFHAFSKWAVGMIQDFNEIDRYLINSNAIFNYLSSVKELNHWYLQEEKTLLQKKYIRFWNTLSEYYNSLGARLKTKALGYQGLIYREAVENLEPYLQNHTSNTYFFIGFNALNTAEATIIQEFLSVANAKVFWDIDRVFLEDNIHDAGLFIRKYRKEWPYYQQHPFEKISESFSNKKNIEIIGIPKNIGQAKYIGNLIETIYKEKGNLHKTAIVLGNESLLIPVVNAIPGQVTQVNITSGFPLHLSPVASFFNLFFQVIEHKNPNGWYYKPFINLLTHPLMRNLLYFENEDYAAKMLLKIKEENKVYINLDFVKPILPESLLGILMHCFFSIEKIAVDTIITKCLELIMVFKTHYQNTQSNPLFLEYLYRTYELFNQIKSLNDTYGAIKSIKALKGIYKEILAQETVDFRGEPLEGLQLMGVLESRNLDFDTIIVSSVNEGILPSGKSDTSFIPFDVKTDFGLPTYKEKDAIYAYHFYRLLQRAKRCYLLYNTEPDVLEGSEKSRFLMQLAFNKMENHEVQEYVASPNVRPFHKNIFKLEKTSDLLEELVKVAERGFSPTSLTNYIRNPIQFYYQTVLGIRNEEEVEETVAANTLGTVVHNTLETLYKPLEGKQLSLENIKEMRKGAEVEVQKQFKEVYKSGDITKGKNLIIYQVALSYIDRFFTLEETTIKGGSEVIILKIEENLKIDLNIPELKTAISLKGKVDRVDIKDGVIRIIDYKTGKVNRPEVEIVDWDLLISDYKYSKAFQVLAYALMMKDTFKGQPIEAGIISFKNIQQGFLKFAEKESVMSRKKKTLITNETYDHFQEALKTLILEIFDPEKPFVEKEIA